jgi:hypothetical protein
MHERDLIFRERLIAVMTELNGPAGKDATLRRLVGSYAQRLFTEGGARGWGDLKHRADGATYDSMLKLFSTQSEAAAKKQDTVTVRAFETLALSLIARRQHQADLQAGVTFLDNFIDECVSFAKRSGVKRIPLQRPAR